MKGKREAKRRGDVFSESINNEEAKYLPQVPKSDSVKKLINDALRSNFMFASVHDEDVEEMIKVMSSKNVKKGEVIIQEGDRGDFFYVVESGNYDIAVKGLIVGSVGRGASFGELALVYDCPRAATITCENGGQVWALDRITFRSIVARNMSNQLDTCKMVLKSVPLLASLTDNQYQKLAEGKYTRL